MKIRVLYGQSENTSALLPPIQISQLYSQSFPLSKYRRDTGGWREIVFFCGRVVVMKTSLGCVGHTAFVSSGLIFVSPGIGLSQAAWLWCRELPDVSVNTESLVHVTEATRHAPSPSSEQTSLNWERNSINMYFSLLGSSHGDFIHL